MNLKNIMETWYIFFDSLANHILEMMLVNSGLSFLKIKIVWTRVGEYMLLFS
jgi:hypothetical protein